MALHACGSSFVAHTSELKMQKPTIVLHIWFIHQDRGLICLCFKSFFNRFKTWAKKLQFSTNGPNPLCYTLDLKISFWTIGSARKILSFCWFIYKSSTELLAEDIFWTTRISSFKRRIFLSTKKITSVVCHRHKNKIRNSACINVQHCYLKRQFI